MLRDVNDSEEDAKRFVLVQSEFHAELLSTYPLHHFSSSTLMSPYPVSRSSVPEPLSCLTFVCPCVV